MAGLDWGLLNTDQIGAQQKGFNYAQQVREAATNRQAGQQYATGDYSGASTTLAKSGDIANAQKLREAGQQNAAKGQQYVAQKLPFLADVAKSHASDPDGGAQARSQAFDQIAGEAAQVTGATPQQMAAYKQLWVTNPDDFLTSIQASLPLEYKTAGDTLFQFRNGNLTNQYNGLKTITAPATDNIYQIGGQGGAIPPAAGGSQPPGGVTTSAPAGSPQLIAAADPAAMHTVESRNNPAAVSPKGAQGVSQVMPATAAAPGYGVQPARDNSPAELQRVGDETLAAYTAHYGNAVLGHIAYNWGPGNTDKWLASGGDFAKLPPETMTYLGRIAVAQATQGGQQGQSQPQPQPQGPATPPGVTLLQRGQQAFREPTAEEKAKFPGISQMGANGQAHYAPAALQPTQLTPEALDDMAAIALRNGGRLPPGYARDRSTIAAVTNRLAQLKPPGMSSEDFAKVMQNNLLQFEARKSAGGQAAKGQIGTAINEGTVNNSIKILRDLIPKAASTGSFTQLNDLQQYIRRSTNDATAANFKNAIDSISNEYARVMTGATGGAPSSDSARNEAAHRILLGYNNKTLPAVLDQMQAEMRGRSESYKAVLSQLTGGYAGVNVPFDSGQGSPASAPQASNIIRYDAKGNRIK